MSKYNNKPKPDDRSDNTDKLKKMIRDTEENIEKTKDTMEFSDELNKTEIAEKNKRRREAIEGFKSEIKDEQQNQEK